MAKELKFWNGSGFGKLNRHHIYVAAFTQKQAAELIKETCGGRGDISTVRNYFHFGRWGSDCEELKKTITEPCVYARKWPIGEIFKII